MLALAEDADVIRDGGAPCVTARGWQRPPEPHFQLLAQLLGAPALDEERQPRFRARFARAMVAEDEGDGGADLGRLLGTDEDVQRRGEGRAARALLAAHGEVEAHAVALADGRRHGDVLGLGGGYFVRVPGGRDVELPRKGREGLV